MTDDFKGDNAALVDCINALLSLDVHGALKPHGIGGHARGLLEAAAARLQAAPVTAPMLEGSASTQSMPHFRASGLVGRDTLAALWVAAARPSNELTERDALRLQVGVFAHSLQDMCQQLLPAAEPFGTYVEREDGTSEFRRPGQTFTGTTRAFRCWTLYAACISAPSVKSPEVPR